MFLFARVLQVLDQSKLLPCVFEFSLDLSLLAWFDHKILRFDLQASTNLLAVSYRLQHQIRFVSCFKALSTKFQVHQSWKYFLQWLVFLISGRIMYLCFLVKEWVLKIILLDDYFDTLITQNLAYFQAIVLVPLFNFRESSCQLLQISFSWQYFVCLQY